MRLRIELDTETTEALARSAVNDRRPIPWQAEVLLRQALGLSFPAKHEGRAPTPAPSAAPTPAGEGVRA